MMKSVMKFLKENQKSIIMFLLVVAVVFFIMNYNDSKASEKPESMDQMDKPLEQQVSNNDDTNANNYASVNTDVEEPNGLKEVPSSLDASELLPNDSNSDFASVFPNGKDGLESVNMLKAGTHIGINTVSSSLRNANLQLRSEPPNPQGNVGPFNQSTIQPDTLRTTMELGNCSY